MIIIENENHGKKYIYTLTYTVENKTTHQAEHCTDKVKANFFHEAAEILRKNHSKEDIYDIKVKDIQGNPDYKNTIIMKDEKGNNITGALSSDNKTFIDISGNEYTVSDSGVLRLKENVIKESNYDSSTDIYYISEAKNILDYLLDNILISNRELPISSTNKGMTFYLSVPGGYIDLDIPDEYIKQYNLISNTTYDRDTDFEV